jgi:hypothetical protein
MLCDVRYPDIMEHLPVKTRAYHERILNHFLKKKGFLISKDNVPEKHPNQLWTPPPISSKSKKIKK